MIKHTPRGPRFEPEEVAIATGTRLSTLQSWLTREKIRTKAQELSGARLFTRTEVYAVAVYRVLAELGLVRNEPEEDLWNAAGWGRVTTWQMALRVANDFEPDGGGAGLFLKLPGRDMHVAEWGTITPGDEDTSLVAIQSHLILPKVEARLKQIEEMAGN